MSEKKGFKEFFLSSWAVDNRVTTYLITIIIVLIGYQAYMNLPKENFPEITIPTIYIGTPYPGTLPEAMEEKITYHIEKELKSIKGVKNIKSNSIQDFSVVIVEFETSVDIKEAKKEVKDAVDRARSKLPNDLPQEPIVQDINLSEIPVMFINVYGTLGQDELKRYAEDLQDKIETLPEVRRVDLVGAQAKEVQIDVDLVQMEARGVTFGDIENALRQRDVLISGGNVTVGEKDYAMQVSGKFHSVEEIRTLTVRNSRGMNVILDDMAEVNLLPKDAESYARLNGKPVLTLNVIKKADENLVSASDKINVILDEYRNNSVSADHKGKIDFKISADQSIMTRGMLSELVNTVIFGFLLMTIVMMFFMGLRDSAFVALAVPLSSLIAFAVMPWIGFTLNLVVLFTFIYALGNVVDNSVVVIDNTWRVFRTEKLSLIDTVKKATGEVIGPVFAGTLTAMAPFLPLAFWEGTIGEFMFFMPITIIITSLASILVAYFMNPVFAVSFMKKEEDVRKFSNRGFLLALGIGAVLMGMAYLRGVYAVGNTLLLLLAFGAMNRWLLQPVVKRFQDKGMPAMLNFYRAILRACMKGRRPYWVLGGVVALLIGSLMLVGARPPKVVFFPETDPAQVYVYTSMPIGTNIERTNALTQELEKKVTEVIGADSFVVKSIISNVSIGAGDQNDFNRTNPRPHKSKISIEFIESKDRKGVRTTDIMDRLREGVKEVVARVAPEAVVVVEKQQGGPPQGKPVNIEVRGEVFARVIEVAEDLRNYLLAQIDSGKINGVEQLKWDLELDKPQLDLRPDYAKMESMGMNTAQVGMAIRTAIFGKEIGKYREGEDEYPIMLRLDDSSRTQVGKISDMRIRYREMATGAFHEVPISAVATVNDTSTFGGVNRIDLKKVVTITSNVLSDFNPNEVVATVTYWMDKYKKTHAAQLEGVEIEMTGQTKEQAETSAFLGKALLTSILLIILILIAQFNSLLKVGIIGTQIIFSMIGVFLGFSLSGMDFSVVMGGVGIVALAGIVVNNGIILLDFIQEMQDQGMGIRRAIVEGGATRFVPVILTASSNILGLMPLAFSLNINFATLFTDLDPEIYFGGDNAAFWGPLAWTIIYGLTFATLITLVIVPVLYYITYRMSVGWKRRTGGILAWISRQFYD